MSCKSYFLHGGKVVKFLEDNDDLGCLCTFPHDDVSTLDAERVRSLAYLGAAVVLLQRGLIEHGYLPDCLSDWIRREIDAKLAGQPLPNVITHETPCYVALKKPGDCFYTWYDRSAILDNPTDIPTKEESKYVTRLQYKASGELISREDGARAEVWKPMAP
jgi:hypothetical protein